MRCETMPPPHGPRHITARNLSPHSALHPLFSKDNSLKSLNYRTGPKTGFKTRLFRRQEVVLLEWKSIDSKRLCKGTFLLLLQFLHQDHISRFTWRIPQLSPTSEQRVSEFLKLICCPCTFSPHTPDFEPKCISFLYYKASLKNQTH